MENNPHPGKPAREQPAPVPRALNIGSGKAWDAGCLNVDVTATWRPDIVADLNEPFPAVPGEVFETERFGAVELEPGAFEHIRAHDVLEHIRELTTCMASCLSLLRVGGTMDVIVPYDLSYGAWQDPTHVRAFNERSWLYYTDWFWYLGWQDARFRLAKLDMRLSESGHKRIAAGEPVSALTSVPRAIDAMHLVLEKIPLSENDRKALSHFGASPR